MKKFILVLIAIATLFLTSCEINETDNTNSVISDQSTFENDSVSENSTVTTVLETTFDTKTPEVITGTTDYETDNTVINPPPAIGGTATCKVHVDSYHSLPQALYEFVGEDKVSVWLDTLENIEGEFNSDTDCPIGYNIKLFIDKFQISREDFAEHIDLTTSATHNLNVLYSYTTEKIDQYYRNFDERMKDVYRSTHQDYIFSEMYMKHSEDIQRLQWDGDTFVSRTLAEWVIMLDINREEFQTYIDKANKTSMETFGVVYSYDYNLDMIYGTNQMQAGNVDLTEPSASILAVNEDDDPTNDISSNELNEMFCRVGRYAE